MNLQNYNKAFVPVVVAVVLFALSHFNITPGMNMQDAITAIVTSAFVFLVPNKS